MTLSTRDWWFSEDGASLGDAVMSQAVHHRRCQKARHIMLICREVIFAYALVIAMPMLLHS